MRWGRKRVRTTRAIGAGLILSVVVTGLIVAAASEPVLIGTWFTLFTEERDGAEVYRVEGRATSWTFDAEAMTGVLEVEVRITNRHPVDIHINLADFVIKTLPEESELGGEVTLTFALEDVTILSGEQVTIQETAHVVKFFGIGNKYLVEGFVEWQDIFPPPDPRGTLTHTTTISEVHSVTELMPPT